MILQHGSGGPNGGHELWAKTFNEMGIASFLVDSFSGRGIVSTSANQALLGRLNMILDGYRAFDVLADHPRIDPARIAVMGFSRGGQSTLYSSMKRFQQMWNPRAAFAAYIPLYASCSTMFIGDTDRERRRPSGSSTALPTITCRWRRAARISNGCARRDATCSSPSIPTRITCYDNPLGNKTPTVAKGAQSVRACKLKEEPLGTIINAETGQPFTYKDPCVQIDPHTGYNEAGGKRDAQGSEGVRADGVQARMTKPSK